MRSSDLHPLASGVGADSLAPVKKYALLALPLAAFAGLVGLGCITTTYRNNGCVDGQTADGQPCTTQGTPNGTASGGASGSTSAPTPPPSGSSTNDPALSIECTMDNATQCSCIPSAPPGTGELAECRPETVGDAAGAFCCATDAWPSNGNCTCGTLKCRVDANGCECVFGVDTSADYNQSSCTPTVNQHCCVGQNPSGAMCECGTAQCGQGQMPVPDCSPKPILCNNPQMKQRAVGLCK